VIPRTRVLLYVPGLDPGGTELRVWRLATSLDRDRFQPMVAWSDNWGSVGQRLEGDGVSVFRLALHTAEARMQSAQKIRELQPDIFHAFSYRRSAHDVQVAQDASVRTIVTSRVNSREWDPTLRVQDWELMRNRRTHRITAVSEAVADLCSRVEGVDRTKITVIHNGVPIPENYEHSLTLRQELALPDDAQLIGCVANYRAGKGHEQLFRAFRQALDLCPHLYLVCCGFDVHGLKASLQEAAERMEISDRLSLLDSRSDMDSIYRAFDAYVQPSLSEGLSVATLEAMSYGLPIAATAVGGTPEAIVDGTTGLLVAPSDDEAMFRAIVRLASDRAFGSRMGKAARQTVQEHFSLGKMVAAHERLYEALQASEAKSSKAHSTGRRIRVLFHTDYLWSGGLEKKVGNLIEGLDRRRYEPIASWARREGHVADRLAGSGIPVVQINPRPGEARPRAVQQIKEIAPDIFHSFSCTKDSADVLAAHAAGVPAIITNRGSLRYWDGAGIVREWEKERNRLTTKVIADSDAVAEVCSSVEGIPRGDIVVIHNGVNCQWPGTGPHMREQLNIPAVARVAGYAATYRAVKGHEALMRAFCKVLAREPDFYLVCCGEQYDDTKEKLEVLVEELGLDARVMLLDCLLELDAFYRTLDFYVHPSFSEGFSNSILEAMAHGLPVIATAVGGTPEAVVDGETGLLVPPANDIALADAMLAMLGDTSRARQMSETGHARVRDHFSLTAMVEAYQQIYECAVRPVEKPICA